jgi:hypothetical protein
MRSPSSSLHSRYVTKTPPIMMGISPRKVKTPAKKGITAPASSPITTGAGVRKPNFSSEPEQAEHQHHCARRDRRPDQLRIWDLPAERGDEDEDKYVSGQEKGLAVEIRHDHTAHRRQSVQHQDPAGGLRSSQAHVSRCSQGQGEHCDQQNRQRDSRSDGDQPSLACLG